MPAASSKTNCKKEEERLAALQKEYNNGEPERRGDERNYQKYLDRVAELKAAVDPQGSRHRRDQARTHEAAAVKLPPLPRIGSAGRDLTDSFATFDQLATMVAVVTPDGQLPVRQCVVRERARPVAPERAARPVLDWFVDAQRVRDTVAAVARNEFSTSRFEAQLRRPRCSPTSRCRCT